MKRSWLFVVAAGVPAALLLLFCAVGIHEWWLIRTHQIIVTPPLTPGMTTAHTVPASALLPTILGSGALAGLFGYAFVRGSRTILLCAYLAVCLVVAAAVVRRVL
jgi:hypothetical protein